MSIDGREDAFFSALVKRGLPIVRRPDPLGPWALDYDRLVELADQQELGYRAATPFPHVVLDNAFPDAGKIGLWTKADSTTAFDDSPLFILATTRAGHFSGYSFPNSKSSIS